MLMPISKYVVFLITIYKHLATLLNLEIIIILFTLHVPLTTAVTIQNLLFKPSVWLLFKTVRKSRYMFYMYFSSQKFFVISRIIASLSTSHC